MASLPHLTPPYSAAISVSSSSSCTTASSKSPLPTSHFFPQTSQLSLKTLRKKSHRFSYRVSCHGIDQQNESNRSPSHMDRRDMLIGLGGLYGLTGLTSESPQAFASPILPPDISTCGGLELPANAKSLNCCPPKSTTVVDFKLSTANAPLRLRPAAHLADKAYIAKYTKALELMKALPDDDPRSFTHQSAIHCAYCNGGYRQVGFPNLDLQVHNSWLFLPFHRYYLYFFERILGSLIKDPSFGIPYWNWDAPAGMQIPAMFNDSTSILSKALRNASHKNKLVDLDYSGSEDNVSSKQTISANLSIVYRQMVSNGKTAKLFHGAEYRAGGTPTGGGSLENYPHGPVHVWCGDSNQPNGEDMGNFYSAGRDPLFYAHHANVDRMWTLWKQLDGGKRQDFTDPDWLNSGFLFYDENKNLVRVQVKDCLDEKKLGFMYQQVEVPWIKSKPTPRLKRSTSGVANAATSPKKGGSSSSPTSFPKRLNKAVRIQVQRPKKSRTKKEKEAKEEVLVIDGIQLNKSNFVKFDVYINDEDEPVRPDNAEYAGSFVNVPQKHRHEKSKVCLRLGLTDLMEELDADDDETVIVTLTPRAGCDDVTIDGIRIEFGDD